MQELLKKSMRISINRAKLNLYNLFLRSAHVELSDTEIEIMYLLSREQDIQELLEGKKWNS